MKEEPLSLPMPPSPEEPPIVRFAPQPGPQEQFLTSRADIVVYGGSAGSGKTMSLIMEPLRHINNPLFGAVIFRRTYPQITNTGGLWDEARALYTRLGAEAKETSLDLVFPHPTLKKRNGQPERGATVTFAHMQHDTDVDNWYGAQIPCVCFDELTQFSESQFWFMLSRNRSGCGVPSYMRATCNPDADSWVAKLIEWWIDQDSGYPIPERGGVLRWFVRISEQMEWGDSWEELHQKFPTLVSPPGVVPDGIVEKRAQPKTLTFIPAKLTDNAILMSKDPGYLSNLMSLTLVERERLLNGNWKIRPAAGLMFPRDKWQFVDKPPEGKMRLCRFWDKAGTEGGAGARTAGILIGEQGGRYFVVDGVWGRWSDLEREKMIRQTADQDRLKYGSVAVGSEQEPGSGGKDSARVTVRNLAGHVVFTDRATGDKASRWMPFACQVQAGNVFIVKGKWDWQEYIRELDNLAGDKDQDKNKLKDMADASAGAFKRLALSNSLLHTGAVVHSVSDIIHERNRTDVGELMDTLYPQDRFALEHADFLRELGEKMDREADEC